MVVKIVRNIYLITWLYIILSSSICEARVCNKNVQPLQGEWHEWRKDEFIMQFSLSGENALPVAVLSQDNSLPDVVMDTLTQLQVMRDMLNHLGFQLPLKSERYSSQLANHILVRFRKINGLNGRAFDEVRRLSSGECVLIIEIDINHRSSNLTPAHEFFHLVQSGYMPFKRPWLYEGTARWAETILGKRDVVLGKVPSSEEDLNKFWSKSYSAVSTWYSLIGGCVASSNLVTLPDHLLGVNYLDGRRVIVDENIPGFYYIRNVLESLGKLGESIGESEGLNRYRWPEKNQKDYRFDKIIWSNVIAIKNC